MRSDDINKDNYRAKYENQIDDNIQPLLTVAYRYN
jgi:hypothetical protein